MSFETLLLYILTFLAIGAAAVIIYTTRPKKTKNERKLKPSESAAAERWHRRIQKSITSNDAEAASYELRILGLEREILSDAIRYLYEAHAEGRITEGEREQLAERYKTRIRAVKDAMTESERVVALHELESMQEDMFKLFNERFDELSIKIENLRSHLGASTKEPAVVTQLSLPQIETEPMKKTSARPSKKKKVSRESKPPRKVTAEKRIKKIREEVEKVLDRLEQMEVEP